MCLNTPGLLDLYILDDGYFLKSDEEQQDFVRYMHRIVGVDGEPAVWQHTDELYRPDCATEMWFLTLRQSLPNVPGVHIIARKKPRESHFKAGNLNNFLFNYLSHTCSDDNPPPDFVLILDHDMVPSASVF